MVFADGWTCPVCWKPNRPQDLVCYRCKTERSIGHDEAEAQRKALAEAPETPEVVPDLVVALPVVIFRGYAKAWRRGGIGAIGVLGLMVFGGVTNVGYLIVTLVLAGGLFAAGLLSGEVVEGMRGREAWAFVVGVVLSVAGVFGSVTAFQVLAPGLLHPNAVRWGSLIIFGGAGLAALGGLVLLVVRRDRTAGR